MTTHVEAVPVHMFTARNSSLESLGKEAKTSKGSL